MQQARVYAPATIGNIGPGFDVLGLAITNLGDIVEARKTRSPGIEIIRIKGEGGDRLPLEAEKNTAGIAAVKALERIGERGGATLVIEKGIPFPSGLGSSAASAVAGAAAINYLFDGRLSAEELLIVATEAEAAVSGGCFADNTAASLYGGFVVTHVENEIIRAVPVGWIPDATIVVAIPEIPMPTATARAVLPKKVPFGDFVTNMANTAMMVAAVAKRDAHMFGGAVDDRIIEPARKIMIEGFDDVKAAALKRGAFGCSIAGAGASVFAVCHRNSAYSRIGEAMKLAFKKHGVECHVHVCNMDKKGTRLVR
jgi:homoserine kinase